MGLDSNGIKFLLHAKKLGADLSSTATIGRQIVLATPDEIYKLLLRAGKTPPGIEAIRELLAQENSYSERLLDLLGSNLVDSFDASNYEGATLIHDFNDPLPEIFKNSYSVVLDGGTLEHIFNYPVALRNCMEMVAEGGHFLAITPTNNFPGHGFYQFSPELFFRVFSEENGFEILDMVFTEDYLDAPWYRITDPASTGRRVTFENSTPSYLLLIARRTSIKPIFQRFPQQSDYLAAWQSTAGANRTDMKGRPLIERILKAVPRRLRKLTRPRAIRYEPGDLVKFDPFDNLLSPKTEKTQS